MGDKKTTQTNIIKGVKAFNQDLTCRDFQFKEGEFVEAENE